jgi:hypothetical protein
LKEIYGHTVRRFGIGCEEHLRWFRDNNTNSKFTHLLQNGHAFAKIYDVREIMHYGKKEQNLTIPKRLFVYREIEKGNQLNDKILSLILKFFK